MPARSILFPGLVLAAALAAGAAAGQGIQVAVLPGETNAGHSVQFDLEVTLPDTSASFNAFELAVTFDDTLLTLVSNQEGGLMTGACGNRFHVFDETGGVFTVTNALLCAATKVAGPGVLYTLRFQTGADATITWVRLESASFSDAGVTVTPVERAHALVRIGDVTGIHDPPPPRGTPRLSAPYPNPFTSSVRFEFAPAGEGPVRLDVYDVSGRLVRRLAGTAGEPGTGTAVWDGVDARGRPAPPGIYLVHLASPGHGQTRRIVKME